MALTPDERKRLTNILFSYHVQKNSDLTGLKFIPKSFFNFNGKLVFQAFESELNIKTGFITERVSNMLVPEDSNRTLYVYNYRPDYAEIYETGSLSSGSLVYYIPVMDLMKMNSEVLNSKSDDFSEFMAPEQQPKMGLKTKGIALPKNASFAAPVKKVFDLNEGLKELENHNIQPSLLSEESLIAIACILYGKPESGYPRLNELIKSFNNK